MPSFSQIQLLSTFNLKLLNPLEEIINNWDTDTSLVGPVFLKIAPFLKMYVCLGYSATPPSLVRYTEYSSKYSEQMGVYQQMYDRNMKFRLKLEELVEQVLLLSTLSPSSQLMIQGTCAAKTSGYSDYAGPTDSSLLVAPSGSFAEHGEDAP